MNRNHFWKLVLILLVLTWSVAEFYPPKNRNLIDVFQEQAIHRDTNFTAIVARAREMDKARPNQPFNNLREAVGTNDITHYFPYKIADTDPTRAILNRVQQKAAGKIKLGLDLQGGTSFVVGVDTSHLEASTNRDSSMESRDRVLSQAVEVLRKRVDRFGVAEPLIQPMGDNRIVIQLPGLSEADKDSAKTQLSKAAYLEFRLVHPESAQLIQEGLGAPGYERLSMKRKDGEGRESIASYLVRKKAERGLSGKYVESANVTRDMTSNRPEIILRFNSAGAELFGEITKENVGHQLAIVLDGELYSAPVIQTAITGGVATINGQFDLKEAFELANVLQNPLEAPVHIMEEHGVDPSLGNDAIRSGVRAAVIGTVAVAGFMAVYYLLAGMVANVALISNIIILLGVMCSFGTTLTLPGIAGIVLTIGMAVDANVLIFERIREELSKGKSLRGALSAGYSRAFGTIFDSHVTTLISSVILIFMGTGSIKGFGVALTIGVAASLFTALVVTRLIFDFLLAKNMIKGLPMLHLIRTTKLDFMAVAKPAFIITWSLIVIGLGYGVHRGHKLLGVDFAGGDQLGLSYTQKVESEQLRAALTKAGILDPSIQYQKDIGGGAPTLRVTSTFGSGPVVERTLMTNFPNAGFRRVALDNVGPVIGDEIQKAALTASLLSLFGILLYVAFRYEFSFAVGAVLAVIHDVLMTIGIYCLSGREFNAAMVAGVLTIIGFSINDTIVIFDRIREDLKMGVRGSFRELINQALNQTLSRTIITSGTVFLATMSLFIFGGGAINDFAFTFLIGIITGTYSSIYIASALVLWWHKGERPKASTQVVMDNTVAARV